MASSNVPEFGKWDKEENVPYTMYFDNARKTRGGKIINPSDPPYQTEMQPNVTPKPITKHEESVGGDGDFRRSPGFKDAKESSYGRHSPQPARPSNEMSPLHPQQARSPRLVVAPESPVHHMQARYPKPNLGTYEGIEKSPVHPQQIRHVPRGGTSPLIEGRDRDGSNGRNGRPRLSQSKNDQGTTVPRFGQWNDKDQPTENYSSIFEKVREEKYSLAGTTPKHSYNSGQGSSNANEPKKMCGCFPW